MADIIPYRFPGEDLIEGKLRDGQSAEKIRTVLRGNLAEVSGSEFGALNVG